MGKLTIARALVPCCGTFKDNKPFQALLVRGIERLVELIDDIAEPCGHIYRST
jgi:hypothetical protein